MAFGRACNGRGGLSAERAPGETGPCETSRGRRDCARLSGPVRWRLCVLAGPAAADGSKLDDILKRGVLRVGTTGDYRPFTALDKATGAYSGFDIDLAHSLADALGVKVEFEPTSWPTLARDFDAGAFDIAMGGVSVTLERAKKGFFSAPYLREGKTPIARCADKAKFETLAEIDRPGVKVIANPGGTNERFDRAHLHAAEIVVHPDNHDDFRRARARRRRPDDHRRLGDPLPAEAAPRRALRDPSGQALRLRREGLLDAVDPPLKAFVDQWLHLSMENGTFAAIYAEMVRLNRRHPGLWQTASMLFPSGSSTKAP